MRTTHYITNSQFSLPNSCTMYIFIMHCYIFWTCILAILSVFIHGAHSEYQHQILQSILNRRKYAITTDIRIQSITFNISNTSNFLRPEEKRTALFWVVTQRVVVIPYRSFGTRYRSHLQGSRRWDR